MLRPSNQVRIVVLECLAPRLALYRVHYSPFRDSHPVSSIHTSCSHQSSNSTLVGLLYQPKQVKLTNTQVEAVNKSLVIFRTSLRQDFSAVMQSFKTLIWNNAVQFLTAMDGQSISRHIHALPSDVLQINLEKVKDMVLYVSAIGVYQPLGTLMLRLIRVGDADSVLWVSKRFLLQPGEVKDKQEGLASPRGGLAYTKLHILLCIIVACTLKSDFLAAFQAVTAAKIPLPEEEAAIFLQRLLRHDSQLLMKVQAYMKDLHAASLLMEPDSVTHQLNRLKGQRDHASIQQLYETIFAGRTSLASWNDLKKCISATNPEMPPVSDTLRMWCTSFIVAFNHCYRFDLADMAWGDLSRLRLSPNLFTCNAMLEACAKRGDEARIIRILNEMPNYGVEPDLVSYSYRLSALFNSRQPQKAKELFFNEYGNHLHYDPTASTSLLNKKHTMARNIVIHGFLACDYLQDAESLLLEMQTKGPNPDVATYNSFLAYYSRKRDMAALARIIRRLSADKITPDAFSFTTILHCLSRVNQPDALEKCWGIMESMGFRGNVVTFTTVIDGLVREGVKGISPALDLLAKMERDPREENRPNEVTYTTILAGIFRDQSIDNEVAASHAKDLLNRMESRGISPNRITRNILINAAFQRTPGQEGTKAAMAQFEALKESGYHVKPATYYLLLEGLLSRREMGLANGVVDHMERTGFIPRGSLLELVHRARKELQEVV